MRPISGVDHEELEHLYLIISAKAQVAAAEQLLREAVSNLQIVDGPSADCRDVIRAVVDLREKVFHMLQERPS